MIFGLLEALPTRITRAAGIVTNVRKEELRMVLAQNPIVPAGMYIADPEGRQWADGRMYVYGSRDISPEYYCSNVYHVLSSSDLVHWNIDENSFTSAGANAQSHLREKKLYAPDCICNNGTYYLYYCLSGGEEDEGVATSRSPYGPFTNGHAIKGIHGIDPAVFVDDDGQAYLYWGQFNAKAARLTPTLLEIDPATIREGVVTEKEHFFHEGSSVRKHNGIYYFVYAHIGRRGRPTCLGYATSSSPLGPFKYRGVIVDNYGCDPEVWNNHGCITEFNGRWYVLYHRSTHASNTMRKACIEPIQFGADGTIPEVEMTSQGAGGPLNAFTRIEAEAACGLTGKVRIAAFDMNKECLANIHAGDTAVYRYIDFGTGAVAFSAKVMGASAGGNIEIRLDSPTGALVGTCPIPPTTDAQPCVIHNCPVSNASGVHAVYMAFTGAEGRLFYLDWFTFAANRRFTIRD